MNKSKLELITRVENIYNILKDKNPNEYVDFAENILEVSEKKYDKEELVFDNFYKVLKNVSNTNVEILSGGKTIVQNYKYFVNDFLKLRLKNGLYVSDNQYINDLSIEELKYVLLWIRRISKANSKNNKKNNNRSNNNRYDKKYENKRSESKNSKSKFAYQDKYKKEYNDSPFAVLKGKF
jgi:hypothetical protein